RGRTREARWSPIVSCPSPLRVSLGAGALGRSRGLAVAPQLHRQVVHARAGPVIGEGVAAVAVVVDAVSRAEHVRGPGDGEAAGVEGGARGGGGGGGGGPRGRRRPRGWWGAPARTRRGAARGRGPAAPNPTGPAGRAARPAAARPPGRRAPRPAGARSRCRAR